MHGFFSLSTPHLGTVKHHSRVASLGMWIVKKVSRSKALEQLNMNESSDKTKSNIYVLSQVEGLNWFKHVVLVSSHQDLYVPYDSARIQTVDKERKDRIQSIKDDMVNNLINKMSGIDALLRLTLNFRVEQKSIDSVTGKMQHCLPLEIQELMEFYVYRYRMIFH